MSEYDAAKKRAREIANFYRRLIMYAGIVVVAAIVDISNPDDGWWFYWAILGFGFIAAKQAWCVFGGSNLFNADWQERKAAELMGQKPKRKNAEDYFDEIATE
jgi:hypothetical protein